MVSTYKEMRDDVDIKNPSDFFSVKFKVFFTNIIPALLTYKDEEFKNLEH